MPTAAGLDPVSDLGHELLLLQFPSRGLRLGDSARPFHFLDELNPDCWETISLPSTTLQTLAEVPRLVL